MSLIFFAPLLGAAVGPALAGAVAQAAGWREIMWIAVGMSAACEVAFLTLFRETYKVTILRKRAARLRAETGDMTFKTEYDNEDEAGALRILARTMLRPITTAYSSRILQMMALWGALVFAFFYVLSITLPDMVQDVYDFDTAQTGLSFLSYCKSTLSSM